MQLKAAHANQLNATRITRYNAPVTTQRCNNISLFNMLECAITHVQKFPFFCKLLHWLIKAKWFIII